MNATQTVRLNAYFLVSQFGSCEYSLNRPNENALCLSRKYSKFILNQPQSEQETGVRTGVDHRNHVVAIPAQVEACTDNTER